MCVLLLQWPVKDDVLVFEEVACFIASAGVFVAHVESSLYPPIPFVLSLCIAHLPATSAPGIPISLPTTSVMLWAQRAPLLLFVYTYSLFYSQVRGTVHIPFPFPVNLLTGLRVVMALKGLCKVIFSQPCETISVGEAFCCVNSVST